MEVDGDAADPKVFANGSSVMLYLGLAPCHPNALMPLGSSMPLPLRPSAKEGTAVGVDPDEDDDGCGGGGISNSPDEAEGVDDGTLPLPDIVVAGSLIGGQRGEE